MFGIHELDTPLLHALKSFFQTYPSKNKNFIFHSHYWKQSLLSSSSLDAKHGFTDMFCVCTSKIY